VSTTISKKSFMSLHHFGILNYRWHYNGGGMRALKSIDEAARLLGISPWTVRAYVREGKLPAVRLGRRVLVTEDALERFVAQGQINVNPRAGGGNAEVAR
jgi:excisionase family DNA binding protein